MLHVLPKELAQIRKLLHRFRLLGIGDERLLLLWNSEIPDCIAEFAFENRFGFTAISTLRVANANPNHRLLEYLRGSIVLTDLANNFVRDLPATQVVGIRDAKIYHWS